MNPEPPPPAPGLPPPPPGVTPPTPGIATTALVCGILSIVCLGCLAGVPAIICGHVAQGRIKRSGGAMGGGGVALAGLIMGYVSLALTVLIGPILAAIAVPNFVRARQRSQQMATQGVCREVNVAIRSYESEYGRLPMPDTRRDAVTDNGKLMDTLRGIDKSANTRGVVFYQPAAARLQGSALIDLWGHPMHFAFDGDGDGEVSLPNARVPDTVAIWSDGANGQDESGDGDDVASWKPLPDVSTSTR